MAITAIKDLVGEHGTVSYNGIAFSVLRTVELVLKPEYDQADRAKVYNRYVLTVTGIIYGDSEGAQATGMLSIRRALSQPGQALIVTGQGFGDISIANTGNPDATASGSDIAWGPKPRVIYFRPVGGVLAWEVVFQVELAIVECTSMSSNVLRSKLIACNYSTDYGTNASGLTTRRIAGYMEIAQWRLGVRNGTVDHAWEAFSAVAPLAFRRVSQQRQVSADNRRVDFVIVDEEVPSPNALPQGIVYASMPMALENASAYAFEQWNYTISGQFEVAPGYGGTWAFRKWFLILEDTLRGLRSVLGRNQAVTPVSVRIESDKFTRKHSFSCQVMFTCSIKGVLAASGIWKPVKGTSWAQWRSSMRLAWSPRGIAQIGNAVADDVIVDICEAVSRVEVRSESRNTQQGQEQAIGLFDCRQVTKASSWLHWENYLTNDLESNSVVHVPLGDYSAPKDSSTTKNTHNNEDEGAEVTIDQSKLKEVVQTRGKPQNTFWMLGRAVRVRYQPAVPKLRIVAGMRVTEVYRKVEGPRQIANVAGCPMWSLRWAVQYRVVEYPTKYKTPTQPGPETLGYGESMHSPAS